MGLAGYYRRFKKNFRVIARPLNSIDEEGTVHLMKPQKEPLLNYCNIFGSLWSKLPLSSLLSWMFPSLTHPKLPSDQGGDSDIEVEDLSDSKNDEYDQLPPFKPLQRTQLARLSK